MSAPRPTPGHNASLPPSIGRVIQTVERVRFPSGAVREFRLLIITFRDANGLFRTEELREIVPPLDCSCIPAALADASECTNCSAIICSSKHSGTCRTCGRVFCTACASEVEVEGRVVRICRECIAEATTPKIIRFLRKVIWG